MSQNPEIVFPDELFNPAHKEYINCRERTVLAYGGRDSAKSHSTAQKVLLNLMNEKYYKLVLMRKVAKDIRESNYAEVKSLIQNYKLEQFFDIKDHKMEIIYKPNPKNRIIARGLDDPTKGKSLKDPTAVWFEEANYITEEDYLTTSLGLRSSETDFIQEILTFNPDLETVWINNYFFPDKTTYETPDGRFRRVESTKPDTAIFHFTYLDNAFIDEQRIKNLNYLKDVSIEKYRVNGLGLWGTGLEGLVFEEYEEIDVFPEDSDYYYGLDVGFNSPSAFVRVGHKEKKIYWDEIFYQKKLTDPMIVEKINQHKSEIGSIPIVVDSSATSLISMLEQEGYNVFPAIKGANSVVEGVEFLKGYDHVITKRSYNIKDNFGKYVYEKNRHRVKTDKPVKADDHAIDAGRYPAWKFGFLEERWIENKKTARASSPPTKKRTQVRGNLRKSKFKR